MDRVEELRHLLLIIEHGTFTAAARRAHLSQPALTASIRRLEDWAGARLLDRGRTGATATQAALALIPRARAAIAALEDGRRAIAELAGLEAGEIRLGAGATATTYLLPPVLARFREAHPGIHIVLRELSPEPIREGVRGGELDLGIVAGTEGDLFFRDELVLVRKPGRRSASDPFITFPEGSSTREALDRHFPDANVAIELSGIAAAKRYVAEGVGIALISRAAVEQDLASGRLALVPDARTPIERRLALVHRGLDRLPPAAGKLREMLLAGAPKDRARRR